MDKSILYIIDKGLGPNTIRQELYCVNKVDPKLIFKF